MATNEAKRGKGYTAPKGRPTVRRNAQGPNRRMSSTVQWGLAIAAFLLTLAAIFYFGRDFRSAGADGPAPAVVPAAVAHVDTAS